MAGPNPFGNTPQGQEADKAGSAARSRSISVFGGQRQEVLPPLAAGEAPLRTSSPQIWSALPPIPFDDVAARQARLVLRHTDDPVGKLYDHLRTRLLHALNERGWRRVAITSPTRGCGSSLVAANLALSLARRPSGRTVLLDFDLRKPSLHHLFGVSDPGLLRKFLNGSLSAENHFLRVGHNLALGLNARAEANPSELLQEPLTATALEHMTTDLRPDVILFDLPPALENDDVFGFLPEVDGVLLVADGSRSTPKQIRNCEAMIAERSALIGVVLNRAEDSPAAPKRWF